MIVIKNAADVERTLSAPLNPQLRQLLIQRLSQLTEDADDFPLENLAHFVVAEPGDSIDAVEAAMGFSVTNNLVDGVPFGDPEFVPSWEWLQDHHGWFELVFVLTDYGFGWALFVQDDPDTDPMLLALCRAHATDDQLA